MHQLVDVETFVTFLCLVHYSGEGGTATGYQEYCKPTRERKDGERAEDVSGGASLRHVEQVDSHKRVISAASIVRGDRQSQLSLFRKLLDSLFINL